MINGREVTPEEFAQYRATGKLPMNNEVQIQSPQGQGVKKDGILAKLGRNLTEEGYDGVMGVRSLRHVIEQQIRDNVTDFHLENLDAKHLITDLEDGVLVIKEKN